MTVMNQTSWNDCTPEKASIKTAPEDLTRVQTIVMALSTHMIAFITK